MPVKNIHCYVSGRVQGVYFRASTRDKALELGVNGWVRNLNDGRVEVMASADTQIIDSFIDWLYQGPPMAIVENIEFDSESALEEQTQKFTIK